MVYTHIMNHSNTYLGYHPILSLVLHLSLSLILTHLVFNTNPIVSILLHTCPYSSTLISLSLSLSFILCLGTGMCSVSSLLHLRSSLCHMCHIPSLCLNLCLLLVLLLGMCPLLSHSSFQLINLMYLSTLELKNLST